VERGVHARGADGLEKPRRLLHGCACPLQADNLDGSPSDEEVDDKARLLAKERLAVLASRPPPTQKKAAPPPVQRGAATRDSHKLRIWNIGRRTR
jgi:hypothetical protein